MRIKDSPKCKLFLYSFRALIAIYVIFSVILVASIILSGELAKGLIFLVIMSIPFFLLRISPYSALYFLVVPYSIMYSLIVYLQIFAVLNGSASQPLYIISMAGVALLLGLWFAYLLNELSCTYGRYIIGAVYQLLLMFLLMLSVLLTLKAAIMESSLYTDEQRLGLAMLPGPIYLGLLMFMAPFVWFGVCRCNAKCKKTKR